MVRWYSNYSRIKKSIQKFNTPLVERDTDVVEDIFLKKPAASPAPTTGKYQDAEEILEVEEAPEPKTKVMPREFDTASFYNVGYEEGITEGSWNTYTFFSGMGTGGIKDYLKEHMLPKFGGFTKVKLSRMELILEEAIANAVEHGNRNQAEKKVRVSYKDAGRSIFLRVSDEGEGFNPNLYEYNPKNVKHLMSKTGKGLYLMKNLSYDWGYDPVRRTMGFEVKAA